jgi:uncharacterized protein (TIGR02246 family)
MTLTGDDRQEIQDLAARYAHAWDLGDPESWADCFTESGVFEASTGSFRWEGRAALIEAAAASVEGRESIPDRQHRNHAFVIEADGEAALMRSYLMIMNLQTGQMSLGRYVDRLERHDGHWKFWSKDPRR